MVRAQQRLSFLLYLLLSASPVSAFLYPAVPFALKKTVSISAHYQVHLMTHCDESTTAFIMNLGHLFLTITFSIRQQTSLFITFSTFMFPLCTVSAWRKLNRRVYGLGLISLLSGFGRCGECQLNICSVLGLKQKHGEKNLVFWSLDKCNPHEQTFSHLD